MKLRIYGNSVRLRLTRSEVRRLGGGHAIEDRTNLLPDPLVYRIETSAGDLPVAARFAHGVLRIVLPKALAADWARSDEISIESHVRTGSAEKFALRLLIEKDFHCLHGESEDQEDCYPNPRAGEPEPSSV